jgi:hypothetical protein
MVTFRIIPYQTSIDRATLPNKVHKSVLVNVTNDNKDNH